MSKKRLIITSMIGQYEKPTDNFCINGEYDYILVTDKKFNAHSWKNIIINFKDDKGLSNTKKQRYVKTHLCEMFPNYDVIAYIDANTIIDDKLYKYIEENKDKPITFKKHGSRDCIYDEINICVKIKKENKDIGDKLRERYESEGYPKHNGLFENNVIILHPQNEDVKKLFKLWWREIYYNSKRDQLSLNYVIWKYNFNSIINVAITNNFRPKAHKRL